MKIEFQNEKIIVYLYRYVLDLENVEKLNKEVRNLFVKLIKTYNIDFFGYSKVHIYNNKKYGSILEIEKIYNNEFNREIIDLKLVIHEDTIFKFVFDDKYFDELEYFKGKFYLDMDKVNNLYKYLEFGKVIYCPK